MNRLLVPLAAIVALTNCNSPNQDKAVAPDSRLTDDVARPIASGAGVGPERLELPTPKDEVKAIPLSPPERIRELLGESRVNELPDYSDRVLTREVVEKLFPLVDIRDWVGSELVATDIPSILQKYGYSDLYPSRGSQYDHPTYLELAGTTLKVVDVEDLGRDSGYPTLIVNLLSEVGKEYSFRSYSFHSMGTTDDFTRPKGLAHLDESMLAKRFFVGREVWVKGMSIQSITGDPYDANRDSGSIEVSNTSRAVIEDVIPGGTWDFRFILRHETGGLCEIGADLSSHALKSAHPLWDSVFLQDPRKLNTDWSDRAWEAIEAEQVFIGMTGKQAVMSWGRPNNINRTTSIWGVREQWVYSRGGYLYFDDGVLSTIQN